MERFNENRIKDLLNDEKFVEWIIRPTTDLELYWINIMEQEPYKRKEIIALRRMITNLRVDEESLSSEDKDQLWRNIIEGGKAKKIALYSTLWFKVASVAAILLFVIIGSFVFINGDAEDVVIDYDRIVSQLKTEKKTDITYLLLADNQKIEIENGSEILFDKSGNVYANTQRYNLTKTTKGTALNQLIVPNGKTAEVKLNDGTRVVVNSGSHLVFPVSFASNKREIYIDGEVFLKVTKNAEAPFIVKTDKMDVKVLGTSFNVSAYKNEERQSVVLVMGSVAVKNKVNNADVKIVPNQMYDYDKSSDEMNVKKVDVYDYICWQYGFLHFKSEKLSTVLMKLQRYYDMKIDFDEREIDKIHVSGKLDLKENLQHVLKIISVTTPIEYQIKQNSLKINVKP